MLVFGFCAWRINAENCNGSAKNYWMWGYGTNLVPIGAPRNGSKTWESSAQISRTKDIVSTSDHFNWLSIDRFSSCSSSASPWTGRIYWTCHITRNEYITFRRARGTSAPLLVWWSLVSGQVNLSSEVDLHSTMAFATQKTHDEKPQTNWIQIIKRLECPVDTDATYCNDRWTSKQRITWWRVLSNSWSRPWLDSYSTWTANLCESYVQMVCSRQEDSWIDHYNFDY